MDDGSNGPFAAVDQGLIQDKDFLREHTVTLDASNEGKLFRFRLRAYNEIGFTESGIVSTVLAGVPGKPAAAPLSDPTVTGPKKIKVTWTEVPDDGGSDIVSYSLEMDDGLGGDFTPMIGLANNYLLLYFTIQDGIV